ncbi:hypothetical protein [Candidatus Leptofilum sp.]|uniref:hypothetical protein n=1 Tax=Candidatus Leptofilum sp. TaxID=3241576 RepID=UPI003B59BCF0
MTERSQREGCAGWFKWMVATFIALISAGGGIAAWVTIFRTPEPQPPPPATPIVITIQTESGSGDETRAEVVLPEDVFVPTAVPTPQPIVNQPNSNRPSEQDVANFLYEAVLAETAAYLYLDSSYVSYYFTGAPLGLMQTEIADLTSQGVVVAKLYDETQSTIYDIRFINDSTIEVDSCEIWSMELYSVWDSSLLDSEPPTLFPQTITIEQFSNGWFITDIAFYEVPAFCS